MGGRAFHADKRERAEVWRREGTRHGWEVMRPSWLERRGLGRQVQKEAGRQAGPDHTQGLAGHSKQFGFILSTVGKKLLRPTSDIIKIVIEKDYSGYYCVKS